MPFSVSPAEFAVLAAALLAGGLLMGFLAGLFGIGGGGVIVPVLYELFRLIGVDEGVRMQLAIGTSLAVIVPTSVRSLAAHRSKGAVEMAAVRRLGPWVVGGVILGILLAKSAPGALFKIVWVVFAIVMCSKLVFGREDWRLGTELPKNPLVEGYGVLVGFLSTLLSIGGGAFVSTLLMLYNRPITTAVGTSSAFGPLIAIPGAIGFAWAGWDKLGLPPLSIGYVNMLGFLLLVPASVFAAPYGVRAAHGVSRRTLELAFAAFLALIGGRFAISLLA
jgi:uncharacterized membrane protein YfcA